MAKFEKPIICLFAESGDCAAGAMSENPDFIPIHKKDLPLISDYLRNQLECELLCWKDFPNISKKYSRLLSKGNTLGNKLIDIGVFHHKWHKRTTWMVRELENNYPINVKPGATPCLKGKGTE